MRFLVTGATGFVGQHVISELLARNHQVIATSRSIEKAKRCSWFPSVEYIPYDLNDENDDLFKLFKKPDILIHLSWENLLDYKSEKHRNIYLPAHILFLKNIIKNGLKQCVVTGTCLEYGLQNNELIEDTSMQPIVPYGIAKNTLRQTLESLQNSHSFHLKWIRLFYLYGPGQNKNSILAQLNHSLDKGKSFFDMSGGEQLRDYLPIERAAKYIVRIALHENFNGTVNCSSGHPTSILQLVNKHIDKRHGKIELNLGKYPYPDYEPMRFWGSTKKLKTVLKETE